LTTYIQLEWLSFTSFQPCNICINKPEEQKCIRTWSVESRADADSLIGSIITCANTDDILTSKVSNISLMHYFNWQFSLTLYYKPSSCKRKDKGNSKKTPPKLVVHSPDSLGLKPIGHRPEVYSACGKDINVLVEKGTDTNVTSIYLLFITFIYAN